MKKMNKKAQMQMLETIGVIFIFFVLILFGSIFYFKFQEISFQNKQEELLAQTAMDTTLVTLFLPEVQCSRGTSEAEDNCVDLGKVRALQKIMRENPRFVTDYYFNLFSYANITVNMVYPVEYTWTIYDFEKTGISENGTRYPDWERKEATYFVVTLRDELKGEGLLFEEAEEDETFHEKEVVYGFGYLKVEVYN